MKNFNNLKDILQTILTVFIIIGITTLLYLYTSGYRLAKDSEEEKIDITRTGMVSAKSIPETANVYLDGELLTATNDTIPGIKPGKHELRISKKGFIEWSKEIEVFPELVTDITAVLVSQSPRLEPLTNTGARDTSISPTATKLAYFSNDQADPGIWVIPLSGSGINIFRSNPTIAIEDTRFTKYSEGKNISWSPDETNLLVEGQSDIYYLVDLERNTAETTTSPQLVKETWAEEELQKRADFVEKLEIPEEFKELAMSPEAVWAPDNKKFLYKSQTGQNIQYKVYNFEKPLPIGEQEETLVLELNITDPQPYLTWYSDSFHLVMVEGNIAEEDRGVISLIRIDGTNKTEIYSNTLMSENVYSSPEGDKVIILTSFKSTEQTDLYTVSIR